MKREDLDIYHIIGEGVNTGIANSEGTEECPKNGTEVLFKEDADKVMNSLEYDIRIYQDIVAKAEARIKELNEVIIAKDMAGAELYNENKALKAEIEKIEALRFNEKDLRKNVCHSWAKAQDRIKELEDENNNSSVVLLKQSDKINELEARLAMKADPALYPSCADCDKCRCSWVYCCDDMPNETGRYYVCQKDRNGVATVTTRKFHKKTGRWAEGRWSTQKNVYAWMSMAPIKPKMIIGVDMARGKDYTAVYKPKEDGKNGN